ncbi:pentatricopeptide repeat-containing protein At2g36730-like [Tasmannia lanceolata]|uniref:pentatricopeptide repeat-containing protein At2g36730-like n=1 Tax=Tasmannia lanceolata TaxID=3420 RepID=UPI004063E37B
MARFPSPTSYLHYPPKNPNGNLNSVSKTQKCLSLLKLCSSMKQLHQIHAHIQTLGIHQDRFLMSEILRFCALSPSGSLDYAHFLLNRDPNPSTFSWNMLIRGFACKDCPTKAVAIFMEMRNWGTKPNKLTFPFLLKACAQLVDFQGGRQIQVEIVKNGIDSDVYIQNTLIHFYGSCREISDARQVFERMSVRTVVSWNAMISACVENLRLDESVAVFTRMIGCGFEPDETTMVVLLSACTELGNLSLGRWVHCYVIEKGLVINIQLGTALVDMHAKCGAIDYARKVFERVPKRNVWTWSAMILGLAQHGLAKEALDLFLQMRNCSIKPNYVTFLGVLSACSHAGLVDDGFHFFREMVHEHGIEPMMPHYGAMVDILGRRGCLEEAYKFITSMPIEPDAIVWRTLLSACGIHDVSDSCGVGEKVRERLLELEPKRSGNFVMVANMYAEAGLWEEAANVRRVMRDGGLKKMAGESCVEVGGLIHRFLCGDDSRIDCESIYCLLDGLNLHIKIVDCVDANFLAV